MSRAVRVLHVDDEEPLLDLTATFLERERDQFEVVSETDVRDALNRIEAEEFDCVVSDYQMPELDGLEFLRRVRESDPDLPFILFTGQGSEEVASDAITCGATDYLRKQTGTDQYQLLANRVENAVESRRAVRELARYEALVETVGDPMFVLKEDGVVTTANEAMVEMLGARDGEAVEGTHASEFLAAGDYERGTEVIVDLLADPDRDSATYEVTVETASGKNVFAEINVAPLYTETGEYRATVGVVRDISERKRRERRLVDRKEELERYETIVQAFPDEVITLDTDGKFTALETPTGQELTNSGHHPDELLGEPVSTVLDEDDLATGEELIAELLDSTDRETASFEMNVVTKDGDRLPHENHIALLQDSEDGTIRGTVGVLRDISHRKQREKELERKNERLEEFAHIASHDLRNPLNVASGRLELARDDCDSEHLDAIGTALARMETLVEDTLAMARQGEPVTDPEPIEIASVATPCWEAVASDESRLDVTDDVTIEADPDRFRQVLENLFRNAVEHGSTNRRSPESHDDAVEHDSDGVTVRVGPTGDGGFFVEDDGSGIPEDVFDDLFTPGFTTAEDGTGFGLAIVQQIVEAHGWEIRAMESDVGGARFEIIGSTIDPDS